MFENTVSSRNPAENKPVFRVGTGVLPCFEQNDVSVCGTVESHSSCDERGMLSFVLRVPRLSGVMDRIPVSVSAENADAFGLDLAPGQPVMVHGCISSRFDARGHLQVELLALMAANTAHVLHNTNSVRITGEISKPPVFNVTPFGREITSTILHVPYTSGRFRTSAQVPVIFWGSVAKVVAHYSCGETISVAGRFQSREYEKLLEDGSAETRTAFEVSAARLTPIERNLINNRGIFS